MWIFGKNLSSNITLYSDSFFTTNTSGEIYSRVLSVKNELPGFGLRVLIISFALSTSSIVILSFLQ